MASITLRKATGDEFLVFLENNDDGNDDIDIALDDTLIDIRCYFYLKTVGFETKEIDFDSLKSLLDQNEKIPIEELTMRLLNFTVSYQANYCNSLAFK
jgi:hypothetical protein